MIKIKSWPLKIIFLAFIAYFLLRVVNLNIIPVFVDEAIYVRWSQVMRSEPTLRFIPQTDGKQPLFMWATIPFFKVFSDPLLAGRSLSIMAGFGSMISVALLTHLLFKNKKITALSLLVYAVLPYSVFFDRMALADALLSMFGVLSLALSVLLIKTKRIDVAMLLGFSLGGGMLTKSPAIFFYFFALLPFIFSLLTKKIKLREIFQFSLLFLIALIISQIMYGILRLGPAFEMIGSRNQDYLFSPSEVLRHPLNPLIGNLKSTAVWLFLLLTPSFLVALFIGLIPSQFSLSAIMLLTAFLVPALAQAFIAKVYTSRYILFAIYPLLPLISLGLFRLKKYAFLFVILPLVFSGLMIISPQKAPLSRDMRHGYLEEWTAGYGQKEVANYLKALSIQGKKVVVFTEGFFGTLPDGLQIYVNKDPNITVVGSNPYVGQIPPGLKNTSPDNERFLVINKSRNHLNAGDLQNLTLIKEYPKAVRPDGTQEALQLYRYHAN